jgi:hypothetical protein
MRAEYFLASLKSVALLTGFAKYCRAVSRKSQLPFASKICGGASASSYAHYREFAPLRRSFLACTHFRGRMRVDDSKRQCLYVLSGSIAAKANLRGERAGRVIGTTMRRRLKTQRLKVESAFAAGNREMGFTR